MKVVDVDFHYLPPTKLIGPLSSTFCDNWWDMPIFAQKLQLL